MSKLIALGVEHWFTSGAGVVEVVLVVLVDVVEVEVVLVLVVLVEVVEVVEVVVGPLGHFPSLVSPTPVKVNRVVCLQNAINEPLVLLL